MFPPQGCGSRDEDQGLPDGQNLYSLVHLLMMGSELPWFWF